MYSAKSSFERYRPRRLVREEEEEDEEENNDHDGPFAFVTKPTRLREDEDDEEEEEEIFLDHDESHDEEDDDGDEVGTCSTTSTVLLEKNRELDAIAMKLQRTILSARRRRNGWTNARGFCCKRRRVCIAIARNLRTLRERTRERCRKRWKARRRVRWSAGF